MENTSVMIGSINDSGFLHGLCRKGFTPPKCLSELIANSIDAGANNVLYNITQSHIKIIDDGKGMKKDAITNMFDMHKENHAGEKTLGVSGVGGKVSTMILSEKKTVMMYTRSRDGQYISTIIPWDCMFKEGKYTSMVKMQDMTENEIIGFHKERENMINNGSGLTYVFQYNDKLVEEIEKQFVSPDDDEDDDIENKISYIYGAFNIDIKYQHYEKGVKQMKKYDYFGGEHNQFYLGKTTEVIQLYEKKNGLRYILETEEGEFEIKKSGKGYKKKPQLVTESLSSWKNIGHYNVLTGTRRDEKYFTETTTEMPPNNNVPLEYEKIHFGESKNETLCKPQLVRNGQIICSFDLPDLMISSSRGDQKMMFRTRHVKCYLTYDPISNLDNKQDIICGIQDNKTQCDCRLEVPFLRLITHIKNKRADQIWNYFQNVVNNNNKPPVVESVSEEVANGGLSDEDVSDEEVSNEEVSNEEVSNEEISNEEVANEEVSNEEVANEKVANEEVANEKVSNEEVANEKVANEKVSNEERHTPETEQKQEASVVYGLDSGLEEDVIDYKKMFEDLQNEYNEYKQNNQKKSCPKCQYIL
jgi:hypothetical protein